MKILFLIGATSRIRHFDRTILLLAESGHHLVLAAKPRKGEVRHPSNLKHRRISVVANPVERSDAWSEVVEPIRAARDYVRYLSPRFERTQRLTRRAEEFAPSGFVRFLEKHQGIKRNWQLLERLLAFSEELIPSDRGFEEFIKSHAPDVMLVTPLVTFESYQTDYVKAAHKLGIPIAFLPFSWDNLSNKGLMRVHPDRTIVWNDTQAREAVELHGCAPESVIVTGAQRFDDFFAMSPSSKRAAFCKENGLDPSRPYVLYLCSSALGGPNEVDFVRRWIEELRSATDQSVRTCGVLIRPHPANKEQWLSADLSTLPGVAVSTAGERNADQNLYDSLHHSAAVVGLNTSALLEAGILGKRIHSLLIPGFDEGQLGTLHFSYLVESNGGLLILAEDFETHRQQLAESLRQADTPSERSRRFIEGFLRPRGIDTPVAPLLARDIEALSELRPQRARRPISHLLLSRVLLTYVTYLLRPTRSGAALSSEQSKRPVHAALEVLQRDRQPVVIGPWLDDLGLEALFWIPFLRWALAEYRLDPARLIAVSRNTEARSLYADLGVRFLAAGELFDPGVLDRQLSTSVPQSEQNPKQLAIASLDQDVIRRGLAALSVPEAHTLHPLVMFRLLRRLVADRAFARIREVSIHQALAPNQNGEATPQLPDDFVAVAFPTGRAFPESDANRRLVEQIVKQLRGRSEVVLLNTNGNGSTWQAELAARDNKHVHLVAGPTDPEKRLEWQVGILSRARGLVGSLGGLTYLAPLVGTSSVAYYSDTVPRHEILLAQEVFKGGEFGSLDVFRAQEFEPSQIVFLDAVLSEKAAAPAMPRAVR